jgi:CRP/FNR family transcriptional regulator, nitrogen oxide reductase regulator
MLGAASVQLFAGMGKDEVNAILAPAIKRKFKASETIIRAEEPATRLMLVMTGNVNFYIVTEKGQQILVRRFGPGNAFGIASFLSEPTGYLGTASAVCDVEAFVWDHRSVLRLARAFPRFPENAFRIALHYFAVYARRHVSLVSDTAQERLAYALTDVASRTGQVLGGGVKIDIRNQDLASLADVSFFTVSRLLKKWDRAGAVEKSRGTVVIRCPEKLLADESRTRLN